MEHLMSLCNIRGIFIQSKDNKTIKHIISLQQRKYRQKFGEYTVEGIRAVTDIGKKDCLRSILIRESKRSELEPLVQKVLLFLPSM